MAQQVEPEARNRLVAEIVERELAMFLSVPADGIYSCQQDPDGFRLHRGVQFSIWSEDTLSSYLNDLKKAEKDGANLMTVKYARMENRLPGKANPLIDAIVSMQIQWQKDMADRYPAMMAASRPVSDENRSSGNTSFATYLRGELETYSDETLSLLYRDVSALDNAGINGSEKIYASLVRKLGYRDLDAAEASQRRK